MTSTNHEPHRADLRTTVAITALVLTFLYRRGYFLKLQRRARSIKMQNRRPINRSEISYPVDDKGSLTRWASQPGVAAGPNQTKSVSAFVVQERHSADSLSNGPQWNTTPAQNLEGARRAAPLPPRPSARPQERESGALGTMDWRTMNPVTPTGPAPVPPPKQDPFADPENDIGSNGKHGKAFNELDEILAMERRQR